MSDPLTNLRAVAAQVKQACGYEPKTLCCSGRWLIELYRHGTLRPGDESLRILIPEADRPIVEEFLKTFNPEAR